MIEAPISLYHLKLKSAYYPLLKKNILLIGNGANYRSALLNSKTIPLLMKDDAVHTNMMLLDSLLCVVL